MAEIKTIEKKDQKKTGSERSRSKKGNRIKLFFQNIVAFFKNERLHTVSGFLCIVIAVFSSLAFLSYFFTWQADQTVFSDIYDISENPENIPMNWMGKLGALLAHQFMFEWFGASSFIFPFILFLLGIKGMFSVTLLPFSRVAKHALFHLFWISIFLGYAITDSDLKFLGGSFGYVLNKWIALMLGNIGAGLLLITALFIYVAVNFFSQLKSLLSFLKKMVSEIFAKQTGAAPVAEEFSHNQLQGDSIFEQDKINEVTLTVSPIEAEEKEKRTEENKEKTPFTDDIELIIEKPIEKKEEPIDEITAKANELVEELGAYDPTLDLPLYKVPETDLLNDYGSGAITVNNEELEANKIKILDTLRHYGIEIKQIKAVIGPTVTLYEIVPKEGIRIAKIRNLGDDIAMSLSAYGIRIIAPMPGKGTIGIEVPNLKPQTVSMRTLLESEKFKHSTFDLPCALGKTISDEVYVTDLAKMPHLLMAGATGQGKSVGLNAILVSLLYKKHPSQIKFVLVDPKRVELTLFNKIERHFLAKLPDAVESIITDTRKVVNTLNSLCIEMDLRYGLLQDAAVRNLKEYNVKFVERKLNPEKGHRFLPYIVLVVDEFADLILTAGKEVETPIQRLAQLARAIGIHLIIATQRPSVNIITGTIKANFPTRIAFRVSSGVDSKTILDSNGAEQLIGRGDMLLSMGSDTTRLQCGFLDTPEVEKITDFIGSQKGYPDAFHLPEYIGDEEGKAGEVDLSERDSMFDDAARVVVQHQQGSASLIQRRLKLGYNRAGRLVDQLEAAGIIGPFEGSKARQVLIKDMMALEQFLKNMNDGSGNRL